jgi:hypothetical protein
MLTEAIAIKAIIVLRNMTISPGYSLLDRKGICRAFIGAALQVQKQI